MKYDTKKPCRSCPYRKDAPAGTWNRAEFEKLLRADQDPMEGAVFGCHKDRHLESEEWHVCAGWYLDQERRGLPAIQLRISFAKAIGNGQDILKFQQEVTADGLELFDSIEEMCRVNGVER